MPTSSSDQAESSAKAPSGFRRMATRGVLSTARNEWLSGLVRTKRAIGVASPILAPVSAAMPGTSAPVAFGATKERLEILDFISQRREGTAYGFLKTKPLKIDEEKDLCGHSIAILNGSWDYQNLQNISQEKCVAASLPPIDLQQFSIQNAAELAVSSGRVEIVASGSAKMGYFAKQIGTFDVSKLVSNAVHSCVGVRRGDPLGPAIEGAIQDLMDDGTYKQIMDKWGITSGLLTKSVLITKPGDSVAVDG